MSHSFPKFSWSNSRSNSLETCKLQYYFNYYGYWHGNKANAPVLNCKIWELKQMTTIPLWTGNIVHSVIAEHLKLLKQTGNDIGIDGLYDIALKQLAKDILDIKNKKWKTEKACRLEEIEKSGELSNKSLDDIERRLFDSLDAYYKSDILEHIKTIDTKHWLSIDDMHSIEMNNVNVFAAADFAFRDIDDDFVFILDWKTGKEKADAIKQQLLVYAELAKRVWNADEHKIKLLGVFLAENARLAEYDVGDAAKMKHKFNQHMTESVTKMKALIIDGDIHNNQPKSIDSFCRTDNKKNCYWCPFKTICNYEMWLV